MEKERLIPYSVSHPVGSTVLEIFIHFPANNIRLTAEPNVPFEII
jgi:hypothetical protein